MDMTVHPIQVSEARPLRWQVLRQNQPFEKTVYPEDELSDSLHLGAFLEGELAGVCTICRAAPPGEAAPNAWRLRGVAVAEAARHKSLGSRLVLSCLEHARAKGGDMVWANARTEALDFYRSLGFIVQGEEYQTDSGPHYLVSRLLPDGL